MSKNKYTHLQALEGEILAMREMGLTRQEIAERLGLSKVQIKNWINRYNQESCPVPKDAAERRQRLSARKQSRRMRSSGCGWRINCCGIFCNTQEGSEAED